MSEEILLEHFGNGHPPIESGIEITTEKFAPVSAEVAALAQAGLQAIREKPFSGRHPELGRKINCCICKHRHYEPQCVQQYAVSHLEEDLETGEKTIVYRTAAPDGQRPTKNQVLSAKQFKGKRLKKHWNRRDLLFVERVRKILGDNFDLRADDAQLLLKKARIQAARELRQEGLGKIR